MSENLSNTVNEVSPMMVVKRNGTQESVDLSKIVRAISRCARGLSHVDANKVAAKTIGSLHSGATTRELDALSIDTAAALISEHPEYSKLAATMLWSISARK